MKFYLSYGAGVGSEALRLWLIENNWPHEAVYVDHGCDWPETREFVKTVPNLTVVKPDVEGFDNLYEYCLHYRITPFIRFRWCTVKFKIRPLYNYFKHPCFVYLGFTIDEAQRVKNSRKDDIHNFSPLVAMGWTRKNCVEYIKSKNMFVPPRSACWFCPLQNKGRWKLLRRKHPELYIKAKDLEALAVEKAKEKGIEVNDLALFKGPGELLENITQERQGELF